MNMTKGFKNGGLGTVMAMGALMLSMTGCTAGEAVVDGFYGGISDTIAGIISETLLAVAGF